MNEVHQLQHRRIMLMAFAALTFGCFAISQLIFSISKGLPITQWDFHSKDAYLIICCLIIVSIIITVIIRAELDNRQATKAELFDRSTGLPNAIYLKKRIQSELAATHPKHGLGLLIIGVGGLSSINETSGYSVGNQVIKAVAKGLATKIGHNSLLTRIAGDKFGILLSNISNDRILQDYAGKIIESAKLPITAAGKKSYVDFSVGSVFNTDNKTDADEFYKRADLAFVHCRSNAQIDYAKYSDELAYTAKRMSSLETGLREALETGQIDLHYQPFIANDLETIIGVEALARWEHPNIGQVPPMEFIRIAEALGLTSKLGNLVLREACRAIKPIPEIKLAVNISPNHFLQPDFISDVDHILQLTGFDPARLEIEITESSLVGAIDSAKSVIEKLQTRGISVALDDFGTGYSSLSYLNLFNVDRIKIDAEFIKDIGKSDNAKSIFSSIFELIRNRGFKITVEGVENGDQVVFLNEFDDFWYQGYLFSKPLPYIDLIKTKFLRDIENAPAIDKPPEKAPSLHVVSPAV